ncbi:cysteine--tRNA ligase, partial [Candidatus Bathyarchaeota archaeon]|nr:cysteine--tRNA ligase [Candidatus Bathyarchaeota archaeon]
VKSEDEKLLSEIEEAKKRFEEAMDDDFNTPLAISMLFSIVKAINNYADANETIGKPVKQQVLKIFTGLLDVLGIEWSIDKQETGLTGLLEDVISILVDVRNEMRKRKEWEIADSIRERLKKRGIILEDTPKGTRWTIKTQR